MIDSIHARRNIPKEDLLKIKSKLMTPREALRLKLVDSIGTFEDFVDLNYPNHSVETYTYRIEGSRVKRMSESDSRVFSNFFEMMSLPQVPLFSSSDPLFAAMQDVLMLIESKLGDSG